MAVNNFITEVQLYKHSLILLFHSFFRMAPVEDTSINFLLLRISSIHTHHVITHIKYCVVKKEEKG